MQKNQVFRLVLAVFCLSLFSPLVVSAFVPFDLPSRNGPREFQVTINDNDKRTKTRKVELTLRAPAGVESMRIANSEAVGNARWQPFAPRKTWYLDFGRGEKIVSVQFRDKEGNVSVTHQDLIILEVNARPTIDMEVNGGDTETFSRQVVISSDVSEGVEHMQVNNSSNFDDIPWRVVRDEVEWNLTAGEGKKTVYVRYRDAQGRTFTKKAKIRLIRSGQALKEGDIVTSPNSSISYYGFDGKLHDYPSLAVFHTWFDDFDFEDIVFVSDAELKQYPVGEAVSPRPGSWMIRFSDNTDQVYAVEPGYVLRPFLSDVEKQLLYGDNWEERVITVNQAERVHYTIRSFGSGLPESAVDRDNDGVDEQTENRYGSSDRRRDTDGDGLTDLEEIQYLSSDPTRADTNENGISDTDMLFAGRLPTGITLRALPENTYQYGRGTVIIKPNGKGMYYFNIDGKVKSMSSRIYRQDPTISGFVVYPPYPMDIGRTGTMTKTDRNSYTYPMKYRQGKLERL